ncbi:hypothetical protein [uncultured Gammaproteobacteria bacterium]|nr:hypothetical protein [uncultured Gammaproteobacteria bacterium]
MEGKFYWNSTPMFGVLLININNRCTFVPLINSYTFKIT